MERDIDTRTRNPLKGFWLKISYSLNTYGFFLLSPSRMSQLKHTAVLRGDVLQDVATGQMFMLHPTDEDRQQGVWEYNEEADGHRWHYIVVNGCYLDWEGDMEEWSQEEMGQWPFGNRLTEEELFNREVEDVLFGLEYYLEAELEWMDRMEDEENEESDDLDDDSDIDDVSKDEGYNTSPKVDFEQFDYWALGLNSH